MTEITQVEARALTPAVMRFRYTSRSDEVFTTTTLVRITDTDGTSGIGAYDSDTFGAWDLAPMETLRPILPRLIGLDADDPDHIEAMLSDDHTSPFPPAVRSTIDIALWDLAARRTGVPMRQALGGPSEATSLPSYASVPLLDDERAYVASIEGWVAAGFTAVKLHAWGDPDRDAALLRSVRARFVDLTLMHDAEGRYDRHGARARCADLRERRRAMVRGAPARLRPRRLPEATPRRARRAGARRGRRPLGRATRRRGPARPTVGRRKIRRLFRRWTDGRPQVDAGGH